MIATRMILYGSAAFAVLVGLGGCAGMSRQDQNTLAGAGLGGVAGGVLTDGSAGGVLGGAAAGGILGHVLTPEENNSGRGNNQYNGNSRNTRQNGYNNGSGYYNNGRHNSGNGNNGRYYNSNNDWYGD